MPFMPMVCPPGTGAIFDSTNRNFDAEATKGLYTESIMKLIAVVLISIAPAVLPPREA
jgi:hypothetical protein